MKHLAIGFLFGLILLTTGVYGQKTAETTKFTSVYTNLDKDCKTLGGRNGTDDAYNCKGVGGYRIYVGSAAAAQMIQVQVPGQDEMILLATQNFDYDQTKIKVEWRLANGKPFAVIVRFFKYDDGKPEENEYFGKKIGEELKITGLKGFENIDFTVDAKTPNANVKAREMADKGYTEKK